MFIYVNVTNREISKPEIFQTKTDARNKMMQDFFETIDADDETKKEILASLNNDGEWYNDSTCLKNDQAYVTDCPLTHADWDAEIFEV